MCYLAGAQKGAHQVEAGKSGRRVDALKLQDCIGGTVLREQHKAKIEVSIGICWLGAENFAELFFGKVEFLLRDIQIANVDHCADRVLI